MKKTKHTKLDVNELNGYLKHPKANSIVQLRSSWEYTVLKMLEKLYSIDSIKGYVSEETIVPYIYSLDNKQHKYYMDFTVVNKDGTVFLIEVKPLKDTVIEQKTSFKTDKQKRSYQTHIASVVKNQDKWKYTREYCAMMTKKTGIRYEFQIWCEKPSNPKQMDYWSKVKDRYPSEIKRIIPVQFPLANIKYNIKATKQKGTMILIVLNNLDSFLLGLPFEGGE